MASSSSASESAAAAVVAPLALSTVQVLYPRLFAMYTTLSKREEGIQEALGNDNDKPLPIDPATGLHTTIYFQDFAAMIHANPDEIPLLTESEGNKYFHFVYQMLFACESGSCGADAWRLHQTLSAALEGALQHLNSSPILAFELLLGWTAAANSHGLRQLFYRGDTKQVQAVFDYAAKAWKKLFEITEPGVHYIDVSDALRNFAFEQCSMFQTLVKQQRKIWGEYAKYSFNFIKPKSRPPTKPVEKQPVEKKPKKDAQKQKKPKVTVETEENDSDEYLDVYFGTDVISAGDICVANAAARTAIVSPTTSCFGTSETVISDGLTGRGGPNEGVRFYDYDTVVKITIKKRSRQTDLGLRLTEFDGPATCTSMQVTTISESSKFHNTGLRTGMIIFVVNGTMYTKFRHGVKMLQSAKRGDVTIYAAFPTKKDRTDGVVDSVANHFAACKDPDGASDTVCGDEKMGEVKALDDDDAKLAGGDLESTDKGPDSSTIDHVCGDGESEVDGTLSGLKRKATHE